MLFNLLFGGGGGKYDSILFGTILVLLLVVFIGLLSLKSEDQRTSMMRESEFDKLSPHIVSVSGLYILLRAVIIILPR